MNKSGKKIKGKKILFVSALLMAGALLGCAQEIRYSPSEISQYPPDIQSHIRNGEVMMGMTPEQVRYAWGAPTDVNILQPQNGKSREEWIYKSLASTMTVEFTGGKVSEIMSSGIGGRKYSQPQETGK
ncbi:MAG: hypothetical protein M0Z59_01295 [Nitrospiraceae bacterium]|nr:hypothetical protein [Nitrospiraceae bacterium]